MRPQLIQTGGGNGPEKPGNRQAPRALGLVPTPAESVSFLRDEHHHGELLELGACLMRLLLPERPFFMPSAAPSIFRHAS